MIEWKISDLDIESTEKILLPEGAHFPEDARNVIRCWHSTDVAACPGSGKTTVLLAKLKLLADRMPFVNGTGICVLSHTNVAVNEIKKRLSGCADKLLSYPNFIGTIQSFVDKFVTMPYLRNFAGRNVQAVDNLTYAQHMLNRMQNNPNYKSLICRIFHYAKIRNLVSGKEFSLSTIKKKLDDEYWDMYRQWIYELSRLQSSESVTINCLMRQKINELLKIINLQADDIFDHLPVCFLDKATVVNQDKKIEKNIFIDPIRGRRIEFDTIHGVKGETHDATLYLETDRQGASDLNRILPYYGVGKPGKSNLFDYSRKLAYVGMSRPRKLLCVAMQAKTYEKSNNVFANDWEIIDLRE